jgi:hypothetical protein
MCHNRILLRNSIIIITIFLVNCRSGSHEFSTRSSIKFSSQLKTIYSNDEVSKNKVCYYFPGNCSSCLITLNRISQDYDTCEIIGITPSTDTVATAFLCEQLSLKVTILFDKDSVFYHLNEELLATSHLFLIKSDGRVEDLSSAYSF